MGYIIGSFNLKNFSDNTLEKRDLSKIAEIITKEKFDVVALQEIFSRKNEDRMIENAILYELEPGWEFQWADAENGNRHEGYAFLWNSRRLSLAIDDDGNVFKPRIWEKTGRGTIIRQLVNESVLSIAEEGGRKLKPFYARFIPTEETGGTHFEIRLICIHTYFGDDKEIDRIIRQGEIMEVLTEIYPEIEDTIYCKDRPSYTIVLGDYNLRIKKLKGEEDSNINKAPYLETDDNNIVLAREEWDGWGNLIINDKTKKIVTVQGEFTTLKKPPNNNSEQEVFLGGYANDYDHFSYNVDIENIRKVMLNCQRIDAVNNYYNGDFKSYHKNVSDHVPIKLEIELR